MELKDATGQALLAELLCIADTDWVLGHWYIKVMLNGRSLTDCTAFAGMGQDSLGHNRALFRFMEDEFELPENQLEFGRGRDQVHDMEMLSQPPENWGDFLVSAYLAEGAVWRMFNTFSGSTHEGLAGMVTHVGKELYFHRIGIEGWINSASDEEREDMRAAFRDRAVLALAWFDDRARSDEDPLLGAGLRSQSVWNARVGFLEDCLGKLAAVLGLADSEVSEVIAAAGAIGDWDTTRRRTAGSELPATLWEFMIPSDPDTVTLRRPLAVSVDDNLDLVDRAEYRHADNA
jgi:hypothetical protein